MADNIASFAFTTQEDWYGELSFRSAEDGSALPLSGRQFVMLITPARTGAQIVEPSVELKMDGEAGLSLKSGDPSTLVFRVLRDRTKTLERIEYTADILEVVGTARYLFMPVRINYAEPSALRAFISRFLGASVSFASRVQPIVTPVAVAGRQGARGSGYLTGQGAPKPADGQNGDYWIDASVAPRRIYGPKAGGAWPAEGQLFATDASPELQGLRDATIAASNQAQTAATQATSAAAVAAARAGSFPTLAALRAIPSPTVITMAEVVADGANNGSYQYDPSKAAAGWVFQTSNTLPGLANAVSGKLDRAVLIKASAPVAADIPAGTIRVAKNTALNRTSLFANDGGTIVDLIFGPLNDFGSLDTNDYGRVTNSAAAGSNDFGVL